jgi:hypothetical protein
MKPLMLYFVLMAVAWVSLAQKGTDTDTPFPALLVVLHDWARPPHPNVLSALAFDLGLQLGEVSIMLAEARGFVEAEDRIKLMARSYTEGQRKLGQPDDPVVIRGFSEQRVALVRRTIGAIRAKLSRDASGKLDAYLSEVNASIVAWRSQ